MPMPAAFAWTHRPREDYGTQTFSTKQKTRQGRSIMKMHSERNPRSFAAGLASECRKKKERNSLHLNSPCSSAAGSFQIEVEKPSPEKLKELRVSSWPIWECVPSTFSWHYEEREICYILEGKAKVKTKDSKVEFEKGDLVIFPKGLHCTWSVLERVKKHYHLGD